MMNILIIYQFCSFGGVERAILNRAKTFQRYGMDVKISVGYLYDIGALHSFQSYIDAHSLSGNISAFLLAQDISSQLEEYDLVFNIDTPQIFSTISKPKNMFIECHTPYKESRQYLKSLPCGVQGIVVPSLSFKNLLETEFQNLPPIFVLPNPVSREFFEVKQQEKTIYAMRPLAYLARLDELKNYTEALDIFEKFKSSKDVMYALAGKSADDVKLLDLLRSKKIINKTLLHTQIGFDSVPSFVEMIKSHCGLFISPSRGESFGLSAAEFMSAEVPVVLSDIDAHRELVNQDAQFLYRLGDLKEAVQKIEWILGNWDYSSKKMGEYSEKFKGDAFINSWKELVEL